LRVIGRVQGVHSVQVHYVHGVTDKQTNQLQYSAPPLSRAGEVTFFRSCNADSRLSKERQILSGDN